MGGNAKKTCRKIRRDDIDNQSNQGTAALTHKGEVGHQSERGVATGPKKAPTAEHGFPQPGACPKERGIFRKRLRPASEVRRWEPNRRIQAGANDAITDLPEGAALHKPIA